MRNYISKNEFEFIIGKHKISESDATNIAQRLFSNSNYLDRRKQYFVNSRITVREVEMFCNEASLSAAFIEEFITLFEVNDDLFLPIDLKNQIITNEPVAVFIGAGVSKLLDYPLWNELADYAIDYLLKKGFINHFEKERLKYEIKDPKQKLSIFEKFCPRSSKEGIEFYENHLFRKSSTPNIYDLLVSRSFDWTKITSNIDLELQGASNRLEKDKSIIEREREKGSVTKEADDFKNTVSKGFKFETVNKNKLYYLHGIIKDLSETIFTIEDYLKSYYTKDSAIHTFLVEVFRNSTVVFIGYGLEEFPILEPVFKQSTKRHYMLMPTYLSEINLVNIKKRYFNSLNIEVIPFYIDYRGYDRLFDVIEHWEKEIKSERPLNYMDHLNLIDSVL